MKISELGSLLSIGAVVAVCGTNGCSRYMSDAKAAEARNSVNAIQRDAASSFDVDRTFYDQLKPGEPTPTGHALCKSATATVPASIESVRGKKYMSSPSDWSGDENQGWQCLHFTMDNPQYYMYGYTVSGAGDHDGDTFTATATGDLDGNGKTSSFTGTGKISGRSAIVATSLVESNPSE